MRNIVNNYLNSLEGKRLLSQISLEYKNNIVYPVYSDIFRAFDLCKNPKVVIIGQDPYHDGSADGLAFSSRIKFPPSLKNIFKEITQNYPNQNVGLSHDLTYLANQGVLLMNASLTVIKSQPNSHRLLWEDFFKYILSSLNSNFNNLVFMLWGKFAQSYGYLIDENIHMVLRAAHPSPLAKGAFFGNKHFLICNEYLRNHNKSEIVWI